MDTFVDTIGLKPTTDTSHEERRAADGRIVAATAFAYRLALSQGRVERDAVEAARRAYLLAGGDLERAGATVDKIVATESRTRHLWLKRPLHPRIVQALLPK